MHIQDLILLVVASEEKEVLRGRTLLQKKLYFLSVLKKEDIGFQPHYYGPYSSWISENLDILVSNNFLKEVTETFPTEQNIFGEIRRHTYSLTDDGKILLEEIRKEKDFPSSQKALERINQQTLADDFNKLSIAAKVYYIVNEKGEATTEQVRQIAKEYGWSIKPKNIQNVLSFLEGLSLISTQ